MSTERGLCGQESSCEWYKLMGDRAADSAGERHGCETDGKGKKMQAQI